MVVRVATLNLWGEFASWQKRLTRLVDYWPRIDADVLLLQEVVSGLDIDQSQEVAELLGYKYSAYSVAHYHETGIGEGIAILSKYPITGSYDSLLPGTDVHRRMLGASIDIDNKQLKVLNSHTITEPADVLETQLKILLETKGDAVLIGGDFNVEPSGLNHLISANNLVSHETKPTWPTSHQEFTNAWKAKLGKDPWFGISDKKLDYILTRGYNVVASGTESIGVHEFASDHASVWVDIEL